MALTVVWETANITLADGSEKVLKRGATLPDNVSDYHRQVYTMIGAVKDIEQVVQVVEAAATAEAESLKPTPAPVLPPDVPPADLHQFPGDVGDTGVLAKPAVSDSKDAWENYAVQQEYLSREEAEALTKTKLVAEVNKREQNV